MAPEEECKNVTTSIPQANTSSLKVTFGNNCFPQLVPQQECRQVPKEVCQTVFLNPRNVKVSLAFVWRVLPVSVGQFPRPVMQPVAKCDGKETEQCCVF